MDSEEIKTAPYPLPTAHYTLSLFQGVARDMNDSFVDTYLIARAFGGEATPPSLLSGAEVKKNS